MKQLTLLFAILISIIMLSGCGKSGNGLIDDDIINKDVSEDSDEYLGFYTLDPSDLVGTWLIESIFDEDTKTTVEINRYFTIQPFDVKQAKETHEVQFPFEDLKCLTATYEDAVVTEYNGEPKYNLLNFL